MRAFHLIKCTGNVCVVLLLAYAALLAGSNAAAQGVETGATRRHTVPLRMTATPSQAQVVAGQETSVTLAVARGANFKEATLRVAGMPAGIRGWFYPARLTTAGSTLFITAPQQAQAGAFTCSIEAVRQNHLVGIVRATVQVLPYGTKTAAAKPYDFVAAANDRTAAPLPTMGTLLNNVGLLARPVPPAAVRQWLQSLHPAGRLDRDHAAQAQLWLGEYLLAHDQQPEQARQRFRQAQRLLPKSHLLYGLAAYDNALALYYEGAYAAAKDAFLALLTQRSGLHGFDRKTCVLWSRMAISCWGYHQQRSALGIPEPTRLDPLCAAAALATCARGLHGAYDKKSILRACRVTGEGSVMADVLAAADTLGYAASLITADEEGLKALPKPLVAYVEHDHYIAVVDANDRGVSYLCSDCGAWPGGRVDLTWKQWRALEATQYVVVRRPGDAWDQALKYGALHPSDRSGGPQLALNAAPGAGSVRLANALRAGFAGHFKFKTGGPTNGPCGTPATSPAGPSCGHPAMYPDNSDVPASCPSDGGNATQDPVELATGEERYGPVGQLTVYNPYGPSISWSCSYRGLRGPGQSFAAGSAAGSYDFTYEDYDFGVGWTQPYNVGVYDPTGGKTGTKYVFYPNGIRVSFTAPAVPTPKTPKIQCSVQAGIGLLVEWDFDATSPNGHYVITDTARNRYVTTGYNVAISSHLLSQIVDRNGHALHFAYTPPVHTNGWPLLSAISNDTGVILLKIWRAQDNTGNITHVDDAYGRSIYYHVGLYVAAGVPSDYPHNYQEIDHISQVVPTVTQNAPDNYSYGYQGVTNAEGEHIPFLHTLTVPSPTGVGNSTATINYASTQIVASVVDANGNRCTYTSTDANGNPSYPSPYTKVTTSNAVGKMDYSFIVGSNSSMLETSRTNGAGKLSSTLVYTDPNTQFEPSEVTDGNNKTTQISYDAYGNTVQVTSPRGTVTKNTFVYTNFALGELQTTQEGNKTPMTLTYYEPSGLIKSITAPLPGTVGTGATITANFTYDGVGNVLTAVMPGNNTTNSIITSFNYTTDGSYSVPAPRIGQPLTVTDNLGHATHFRYDAQGNPKAIVDALGNETDIVYNVANQIQTTTFPSTYQNGLGHASVLNFYLYPGGPLTSKKAYEENGAQLRQLNYSYGAEGEILSSTAFGPNGATKLRSQTFDSFYRVKSIADGNGNVTNYQYNTSGYLASISYPKSNGVYDTVQFPSYDAIGNVLQRIDGRGIVTNYSYNDSDNLLTDIQYPASPVLNIHLEYDAYARRSQMTDGTGSTNFEYDDGNRPLSTETTYTGLPAQTISYDYYPDGSRQTMTTPAGTFNYGYDGAQRPVSLTNPYAESFNWTYQNNYWLQTQTLANGATTTYSYNVRGQLTDLLNRSGSAPTTAMLSHYSNMIYDGVGNRTTMTATIPQIPAYSGQTSYAYNYKDQLIQEQSTRNGSYNNGFDYDPAGSPTTFRGAVQTFNADNQNAANNYDGSGNPTIYKATALTFDPENRLTAYGNVLTAGYTGDGLRAWKQNAAGKVYFLYDSISPVCELDAGGNVVATNTFGINGLLSRHADTGSVFYTFDPQGSTAQCLDINGNALSSMLFDAYGNGISTSNSTDPFGYNAQRGYYYDKETNITLLGFRYYDSTTGHFLNRDPIGVAGGINIYAFVNGSPVTYSDAAGLYFGEDDLAFAFAGGLLGVLSQTVGDLVSGHSSSFQEYAGAFVGGAAGGWALLYTGPVGAGVIAGGVQNVTTQLLQGCDFDPLSLARDTAIGGLAGGFPYYPFTKIAGITTGTNSYNAIFKQIVTKYNNGTIGNITWSTAGKMLIGRSTDTAAIQGSLTAGIATSLAQQYGILQGSNSCQ